MGQGTAQSRAVGVIGQDGTAKLPTRRRRAESRSTAFSRDDFRFTSNVPLVITRAGRSATRSFGPRRTRRGYETETDPLLNSAVKWFCPRTFSTVGKPRA